MSDPIAALIGIILGAACSIPTSLLLVALLRRRQARRRPVSIVTYRPEPSRNGAGQHVLEEHYE